MKRIALFLFSSCFIIIACKNKKQDHADAEQPGASSSWLPVSDFLKSEIRYVDSLPGGIMLYQTKDKKTDTAYIDMKKFDSLAKEFLPEDLKPDLFQKNYSEASFMDQTNHISTFQYTPRNNNQEVKRVDVMTGEENGFDKIKSIYLEQSFSKNDSSVIKKMYWTTKRKFSITTISGKAGQPPVISQVNVVWNPEQ
jgi:hypothetical protein